MDRSVLLRLVALLRRELGASTVDVIEGEPPMGEHDTRLRAALPGGRWLLVALPENIDDREDRARRLRALVDSFAELLHEAQPIAHAARRDPDAELRSLLQGVTEGAGAVDALILDAHSPMVWASAGGQHGEAPGRAVLTLVKGEGNEALSPHLAPLARQAIAQVRALPELAGLHRGGHLHHTSRQPELGVVARSFASIYVLVVVFDGLFDELAAERAIAPAMPLIERFVLSLPPPDPASAGAAVRPRRR